MASSLMWNALEGGGGALGSSASGVVVDPATLLNTQLASALNAVGDAQYWEEGISPNAVRQSLNESDPSNPSHSSQLLRGMKWLLASISKGRDVSDFFPSVVKLVGAKRLEVRKLVYMYLVRYADYDSTTRELSLLSINAFQRGLADAEPLIRALALRVLTSIRLPDIYQIQVLGVQKCALRDESPYVRKCAANALAKLFPRSPADQQQRDVLLQIMRDLLDKDECTMVLTSCVVAFSELAPHRLELLHGSFRKICHLLTDFDEWGQVVALEVLARYCRKFFKRPAAWKNGTAERIDAERRVVRRTAAVSGTSGKATTAATFSAAPSAYASGADGQQQLLLPPYPKQQKGQQQRKKAAAAAQKRRAVRKGFYSDDEDESYSEREGDDMPVSAALRDRSLAASGGSTTIGTSSSVVPAAAVNFDNDEDDDLDPDHRLLLQSAMPLLKSRNSAVVLAVCSLQYYCGISSVKVRSAMGKALVRIHRDRREIQYIVLNSIRMLATECPSAFLPFLHDFFVKALDPPFTKFIKLDILTSLALEPAAIEAVLAELRNYVRDGNRRFACAAVRAVGRVAEMTRIVFDRHGAGTGRALQERNEANRTALNCLYGLFTLTQASDKPAIVGEAIVVSQWILQMLASDVGTAAASGDGNSTWQVDDPNRVQRRVFQRLLLLVVHTLSKRVPDKSKDQDDDDDEDNDDDDDGSQPEQSRMDKICVVLPPQASAAALWILGELLAPLSPYSPTTMTLDLPNKAKVRAELMRLIARAFPDLSSAEKTQGVHCATKILLAASSEGAEEVVPLCEHVLTMGRVDVDPDVRDRARHESALVQLTAGLQNDSDALEEVPASLVPTTKRIISTDDAKRILLHQNKPAPSSIPLQDGYRTHSDESDGFRFGTLSSIVGHRARSAYIPLPRWAEKGSPSALRDPPEVEKTPKTSGPTAAPGTGGAGMGGGGFYEDTESSSSSDDDETSSESSSTDGGSSSGASESSSSSSSDNSSGAGNDLLQLQRPSQRRQIMPTGPTSAGGGGGVSGSSDLAPASSSSSDESSSSSDAESSSSDGDSDSNDALATASGARSSVGQLISMSTGSGGSGVPASQQDRPSVFEHTSFASVSEDLKGLVFSPVAVPTDAADDANPDFDRDSGSWLQLVRSEHAGGLSARGRYLRGAAKSQQALLSGIGPDKPSFVCLHVRFQNANEPSGPSIRRLRILQRSSSSSSSTIGPSRVISPPEIVQLAPGQEVDCVVGIDFNGMSDRDGSLLAKLDFNHGGGGIPVEIRPGIGDLLLPCRRSLNEFNEAVRVLRGFQRVESTISVSDIPSGEKDARAAIQHKLLQFAALSPVKVSSAAPGPVSYWDGDNMLRLAGTLPSSSDPVYVQATLSSPDEAQASVKLTVCCDHALAANSVMNHAKRCLLQE